MRQVVNPAWVTRMKDKINNNEEVEETINFSKAASWLVMMLANKGREFKVYNLGAGVKKITTKIDTCPMCKRRLDKF